MQIIKENVSNLEELKAFLELLPENFYSTPISCLSDASVGQHVRHILEFYISLEAQDTGEICYDNRKRDQRLERDLDFVQQTIGQLIEELSTINADTQLTVKANYCTDSDDFSLLESSLFRELAYALDHTTHHLAIIKIALKAEKVYLNLPENFGIAPSTVRNKVCAQ